MRTNRTSSITVAVAAAALVLFGAATARAQPLEGIKVHGAWELTIVNPDGQVSAVHKFQNALHNQGQFLLTQLLTGGRVRGPWAVELWGPDVCGPNFSCFLLQPTSKYSNTDYSKNLTVVADGSGIVISGSVTVTGGNPTSIISVRTAQTLCLPTDPVPCDVDLGTLLNRLTEHQFPQPLQVVPGQIIQVRVVISFS